MVRRDGRPSEHLVERLERALDLYRAGTVAHVIVSGGFGVEGHEEAAVMAAWLIARGVPPERVIEDREGNSTWDTARNARAIMTRRGWRTAIAVSQYYHLPRCQETLRRFGVDRVGAARARFNPSWKEPYALAREVAARYAYALREVDRR